MDSTSAKYRRYYPFYSLRINNFFLYNLSCSCLYVIHCTYPSYLVGAFEFFCYAFFFSKLLYQPKEQFLCLFVYISKIAV